MEDFTTEATLEASGTYEQGDVHGTLTLNIEGQEFVAEEFKIQTTVLSISGDNKERICERLEQIWNQRQ